MNSLTNEMVMDDTGGLIGCLDAQDKAKPGPRRLRRLLHERPAHHQRGGVLSASHQAAASLYGVGIITDKEDSPHLFLDKIKGELYYAFAETDRSVPPHIPGDLKSCSTSTTSSTS